MRLFPGAKPDTRAAAARMPGSVWAVVLGSRLACFLAAYLASAYLGIRHAAAHLNHFPPQHLAGRLGEIFNPWGNWDGSWYIRIAHLGYQGGADAAFFPLYPMLLRWLTSPFGNAYIIVGVGISLAFYLAAMYLLYRLVAMDYSRTVAGATVAFISLFPTAFYFQAVYTESAFLFFIVACVFFSRRRQWLYAGIAGFLASLTRNTGVLVLLPMAMFYFEERGWRPWRVDRRVAWLALVPAGLLVWMYLLQVKLGDALAFSHAQAHWSRTFAAPWVTVWRGVRAGDHGLVQLLRHGAAVYTRPIGTGPSVPTHLLSHALPNLASLVALVIAVVVLALAAPRIKPPYLAYAVAALAAPLFYPTPAQPLFSIARFVLVIFPVFLGLALLTERHRIVRVALLAVSSTAMIYLTVVFARNFFVA
jgi:Mannosyltransferase (PIG-V)